MARDKNHGLRLSRIAMQLEESVKRSRTTMLFNTIQQMDFDRLCPADAERFMAFRQKHFAQLLQQVEEDQKMLTTKPGEEPVAAVDEPPVAVDPSVVADEPPIAAIASGGASTMLPNDQHVTNPMATWDDIDLAMLETINIRDGKTTGDPDVQCDV